MERKIVHNKMKFKVIRDMGVGFKVGTIVYKFDGCTYGCIGDGMAVTLKAGEYPFFELPLDSIVKVEQPEMTMEYVKTTCKLGMEESCCRYLCMSSKGWECLKCSSLKETLDERVAKRTMNAKGDNCEGI